jgi:hypothetical protein
MLVIGMGTKITAAASDTGLITTIKCSVVHIAFLSSHK